MANANNIIPFKKRVKSKEEFDALIKEGIPSNLYEKIGAYRLHLYPFEDAMMVPGINSNPEEIIESLKELAFSTVYKGVRYYFENGHKLKQFCDLIEGR